MQTKKHSCMCTLYTTFFRNNCLLIASNCFLYIQSALKGKISKKEILILLFCGRLSDDQEGRRVRYRVGQHIVQPVFFFSMQLTRGLFPEGLEKISHPESHSKISNLLITELFWHIVKMNRGSLHTRSFRRIQLSVFRYRPTKNAFVGAKRFGSFRETGLLSHATKRDGVGGWCHTP